MRIVLSLLCLALWLSGCSAVSIEDYTDTEPRFVLEDYFAGPVRAWGVFQDRSGRVKRQFTVSMVGRMEDGELVLEEDFEFRDGEKSRRVWRIRKIDAHHYEGRADDVVGTASGVSEGQALHWQYTLLLDVDGRQVKVHFDDWMFLHEDDVLVNRATMSKFGFALGQVTLFFQKERQDAQRRTSVH